MMMSPGSRPRKGIFPASRSSPPSRASTTPKTISILASESIPGTMALAHPIESAYGAVPPPPPSPCGVWAATPQGRVWAGVKSAQSVRLKQTRAPSADKRSPSGSLRAARPQLSLQARGRGELEVGVSQSRGRPPPRGPCQEAELDQERLVHILDGVLFLADGNGQGLDPHRPAGELLDDGLENPAVHLVETPIVHVQAVQGIAGHALVDRAVPQNLGEVPHPSEQPVGDPGRSPGALGQLPRAFGRD